MLFFWRCSTSLSSRSVLVTALANGRRKQAISSTHYRTNLLEKQFLLWFEASNRGRFLRKIFFFQM